MVRIMPERRICTGCGSVVENHEAHAEFHRRLMLKPEDKQGNGLCARQGVTYAHNSKGHQKKVVCDVEYEHTMHQGIFEQLVYSWYDPEPVIASSDL